MRKNLLKFICFLLIVNDYVFCGSLGAQSIPNGDFSAEWVTGYNGVGKQPAGWKASNVNQLGVKKELVTCNPDGSVLLTNRFVGLLGIGSNAPAYISLGTPWVYANVSNISQSDGGTTGGLEFTHRPDSLVGVFKRKVVAEETGWIIFYLWKGTSVSYGPDNKELIDNDRDILAEHGSVTLIGRAEYEIKGTLSDWTRISIPIDYLSDETPEKMNVILSAADYRGDRKKIKEYNTLSVQSVELVYKDPVSTEKINLLSDRFSVIDKILYLDGSYRNLAVYTMDGRLVCSSVRPENTTTFSFLSAGVYLLRIEGEQGVETQKFQIR